ELATELLAIKPATFMIVVVEPTDVSQYGEEVLSYAVSYVVKTFVISDLLEKIYAIFLGSDFIDTNCKQLNMHSAYR
ncbi:DNA-binding response regulator, partial [Streptococcus suis]